MATRLPYSRVFDVTVTREDKFPTTAGFNTAMFLSTATLAGKVDATARTKLYSTIEEIAADGWPTSSEAYKAASVFFSARVKPRALKVGYIDGAAADITAELNSLWAYDPDWYWGAHGPGLNDNAKLESLAAWAESRTVMMGIGSNDVDTETGGSLSTASIAEKLEGLKYDRSPVFYHTDPNAYLAMAAWGYAASRDLDRANYALAKHGIMDSGQAYTLKFKELPGVAPIDRASAAVQAVSGFVPGVGLDPAQGHTANTYINIGGRNMLVEGTVPSGTFIDVIHASDWLKARIQESALGFLANNARVPYDNRGMAAFLDGAIFPPLRRAFAAGIVAAREGDSGEFLPEYEVAVDDVANIPASQRAQRIAPDVKILLRYAGAIHWGSATITMKF